MMDNKKGIYLILGILVTLIFCLYRVKFYEWLFTAPGFSDEMYNHDVYSIITGITVALTWSAAAIFYYVINSVKFSRWYHWLSVLAIVTLVTPVIGFLVNQSIFDQNNLSYSGEAASFEFSNMIYTALLFTVASFSMRWWSTNCRHTPIPQ